MTRSGSEPGFPRLRPVEASPVTIEGQPHYALRDPSNICEQTLYVTNFTVTVLSLFDGAHDIPGMYREIKERFGAPVPPGAIENLARQLDEAYLLDTPRFRARLNALRRDYAALPERKPAFAGRAYEADPAALQRQLDAFYEKLPTPDIPANAPPRGIVAPHIDISVGGPVFAAAFDAIRRHPADLYIILGTAHALSSRTFCLAPKDFATPLGAMPLHQEAARDCLINSVPRCATMNSRIAPSIQSSSSACSCGTRSGRTIRRASCRCMSRPCTNCSAAAFPSMRTRPRNPWPRPCAP